MHLGPVDLLHGNAHLPLIPIDLLFPLSQASVCTHCFDFQDKGLNLHQKLMTMCVFQVSLRRRSGQRPPPRRQRGSGSAPPPQVCVTPP